MGGADVDHRRDGTRLVEVRARCTRATDLWRFSIADQGVCARDSKDVTRPHFMVGREGWSRFVGFAADA
ncbi:DUF397 domain-containing protein [Streptomyces sp. NBC_00035]